MEQLPPDATFDDAIEKLVFLAKVEEGLAQLEKRLATPSGAIPHSFEALMSVTGFRQTDLSADFIEVHALPASLPERQARAETP